MAGLNDPGWDHLFEQAGQQYNVDPKLLKAVMYFESGPSTDPITRITKPSPAGALGPMQLLPSSFPGVNPQDPEEAIPAAAKYLAKGLETYNNDPVKALMFYHGGPDTKIWGKHTKAYPDNVAIYYKMLTEPKN